MVKAIERLMTDQEINEAVTRKLHPHPCSRCGPDEVKDYCHDIKAAWEIVKKWHGDWELHRQNGTFDFVLYRPSEQYDGQADTAPMAIALAFLKL